MKKLVLTVALICMSQMGFSQATSEASREQVLKLIQLSGSSSLSMMDKAKEQILQMIPSDKKAAFVTEFDASLPGLYDKMVTVFLENYTKEEIAAMSAYYESPIGKQISAKSGVVMEKTLEATKEWMTGFQEIMMKYIQD